MSNDQTCYVKICHFLQTEELNKFFITHYQCLWHILAMKVDLYYYRTWWIFANLCIRKNCLLTFQLGKESTLFISMSTIMFWYIVSMGKQLVPDVTLKLIITWIQQILHDDSSQPRNYYKINNDFSHDGWSWRQEYEICLVSFTKWLKAAVLTHLVGFITRYMYVLV